MKEELSRRMKDKRGWSKRMKDEGGWSRRIKDEWDVVGK